jgi:choline dehydrogenase-like flavoprotein
MPGRPDTITILRISHLPPKGGTHMPDNADRTTDVIVVGAGLAGLACAADLSRAGMLVRVLEASDAVGGRMRTDRRQGFLLDRGFQVFNTSYPAPAVRRPCGLNWPTPTAATPRAGNCLPRTPSRTRCPPCRRRGRSPDPP